MNKHFPPQKELATPAYVLSVIADNHRQQSPFDLEADTEAHLTFQTTVAEWRDTCDLLGWNKLAHALNAAWSVNISDDQWRAVLQPPRQPTLHDVCNLIASRASKSAIQPITILGKPCNTAGAFFTVRHLLSQAGADASEIRPPTEEFRGPISRLAPGRLPPVEIHTPLYDGAVAGFGISSLLGLVAALIGRPEGTAPGDDARDGLLNLNRHRCVSSPEIGPFRRSENVPRSGVSPGRFLTAACWRVIMNFTTLGRTGLRVSRMGLGCGGHSRLGIARGSTADDAERIVKDALGAGR